MSGVKVVVSCADDLLAQIDAEVAMIDGPQRPPRDSGRRESARGESDLVADAIERSERRFQDAGAFEAAGLVRADRDARQWRPSR